MNFHLLRSVKQAEQAFKIQLEGRFALGVGTYVEDVRWSVVEVSVALDHGNHRDAQDWNELDHRPHLPGPQRPVFGAWGVVPDEDFLEVAALEEGYAHDLGQNTNLNYAANVCSTYYTNVSKKEER